MQPMYTITTENDDGTWRAVFTSKYYSEALKELQNLEVFFNAPGKFILECNEAYDLEDEIL